MHITQLKNVIYTNYHFLKCLPSIYSIFTIQTL
ncbi:hypothetical protein TRIP_B200579 [uncultured Desulfatiglans sp.]|nr:hypothetical protein TRIP_B200579 [uncultured Desulfatiglans sp.]